MSTSCAVAHENDSFLSVDGSFVGSPFVAVVVFIFVTTAGGMFSGAAAASVTNFFGSFDYRLVWLVAVS